MNNGTPVHDNIIMLICPLVSLLCILHRHQTICILNIDVEMVSKCLAKIKKCKAPGWDGIVETEHLMHAHPILIIQYSIL